MSLLALIGLAVPRRVDRCRRRGRDDHGVPPPGDHPRLAPDEARRLRRRAVAHLLHRLHAPLGVAAGPSQAPPLHRRLARRDPPRPALADRHHPAPGDRRFRRVSWHMAAIFHAEASSPTSVTAPMTSRSSTDLSTRSTAGLRPSRPGGCHHGPRLRRALRRLRTARPRRGAHTGVGARLRRRRRRRPRRAHLGAAALRRRDQLRLPPRQGLGRGRGVREEREIAVVPHLRRGRAPDPPPLPAVRPDQHPLGPRLARDRRSAVARPHRGGRRPRDRARGPPASSASPAPGGARERAQPAGGGVTEELRAAGFAGEVRDFGTRRARRPTPRRRSAARSAPSRTASSSWPTACRC